MTTTKTDKITKKPSTSKTKKATSIIDILRSDNNNKNSEYPLKGPSLFKEELVAVPITEVAKIASGLAPNNPGKAIIEAYELLELAAAAKMTIETKGRYQAGVAELLASWELNRAVCKRIAISEKLREKRFTYPSYDELKDEDKHPETGNVIFSRVLSILSPHIGKVKLNNKGLSQSEESYRKYLLSEYSRDKYTAKKSYTAIEIARQNGISASDWDYLAYGKWEAYKTIFSKKVKKSIEEIKKQTEDGQGSNELIERGLEIIYGELKN